MRRRGDLETRGHGDAEMHQRHSAHPGLCVRASPRPRILHPSSFLQGHNLARSDRIRYIAIDEDLLQ